jgi:glycosyltransferase involved in cell wall biosynthesis
MRRVGLYLAIDPAIVLANEGLGIHLLNLLEAFAARPDRRLVIACSAQLVPQLVSLLAERRVDHSQFDWITVQEPRRLVAAETASLPLKAAIRQYVGKAMAVRRPVQWARYVFREGLSLLGRVMQRIDRLAVNPGVVERVISRIRRRLPAGPAAFSRGQQLYRAIERSGLEVDAWYTPMTFWPEFNQLSIPRLMVVPDLIPRFFPAGFAQPAMLEQVKQMEKAIAGGEWLVTYSDYTKWQILVARYGVDPDRVFVVRHGANHLARFIQLEGASEGDPAITGYCKLVLRQVVSQKTQLGVIPGVPLDFPFLFYASHFRPHKNILSLLRAYEYLLRQRFIGYKLVLTGWSEHMPEVGAFVEERGLQRDVLFLHSLNLRELASLYHLADLVINPSLMEGGFPFTFTEALSVGTPVVMARIPVTLEVITDPVLDQAMLFDPYDWQDMAHRIEWALAHREELLQLQQPLFEQLARRTWGEVANDLAQHLVEITHRPVRNG